MRILLLFLCFLFAPLLKGQVLGLNYSSSWSCRTVNITNSFPLKNGVVGIGLGFNIERKNYPDNRGYYYKKRLHPTEFINYFNFSGFYHHDFLKKLPFIKPFVFFEGMFKYSSAKTEFYLIAANDTLYPPNEEYDQYFYKNFTVTHGPYYWVEGIIGIGFNVVVWNRLGLQQKAGFGGIWVIGHGNTTHGSIILKDYVSFSMNWMFQVGITYDLRKKDT